VLPAIVVAELYAGVRDGGERAVLEEMMSVFDVLPITAQIAQSAGLIKRDYRKSHGLGLADAIIAATTQSMDAQLATLNVKHYPMIARLKPAYSRDDRMQSPAMSPRIARPWHRAPQNPCSKSSNPSAPAC